jgi:hypothetical protein
VAEGVDDSEWPALPLEEWRDGFTTLHLWLQIVGKVQLSCSPWLNHSWHVALRTTARGLSTSVLHSGTSTFQAEFDFLAGRLAVRTSDGREGGFALEPQSVAEFHARLKAELLRMGIHVRIHGRPNEVPDPVPFEQDEVHAAYDPEYARRFWRILVSSERVMTEFRTRFLGKCSPVHFFWGGADLAVTRFSGRPAPLHPGGIPSLPDWITQEAYSHEVSSAGFWPGGDPIDYPAFYSYAYPEPPGFAAWPIQPAGAFYSDVLREFILPYDVVRESGTPDETLLAFLESSYEAAAELGAWDRPALERPPGFSLPVPGQYSTKASSG